MQLKKIFVTGGTGFLGSYLLRYLVRSGEREIVALKRANSPMTLVEEVKDKIQWIEGDILNVPFLQEVMTDITHIYHCAAKVSFHPRDRRQLYDINEKGTENIVNAALFANVKKLIHTSSIAALGRRKEGESIDEKTKWERSQLNSHYAISKQMAEMQVWRGMAEGLTAAIVNPSLVMGSGFWDRGTPKMYQTLSKNFPFYPPGASGIVDVRDVARFMILLMNSPIHSERFILNGANISYKDLFSKIAKSVNSKPPAREIGPILSGIFWRLEWLRSKLTGANPLYSKENARTTAQSFYYDNSKSLQQFDFKYTDIDDTLNAIGKQFLEAKERGSEASFLPLIAT